MASDPKVSRQVAKGASSSNHRVAAKCTSFLESESKRDDALQELELDLDNRRKLSEMHAEQRRKDAAWMMEMAFKAMSQQKGLCFEDAIAQAQIALEALG